MLSKSAVKSEVRRFFAFLDHFLSGWYRSVDKPLFLSFIFMSVISLMLISSVGPVIEHRIMLTKNYFLFRQCAYLTVSLVTIIIYSMITERNLVKISLLGLSICLLMLAYIALFGVGVKGAKRWIFIFGISVQPSEFTKTLFSVVEAWLLCSTIKYKYLISGFLYLIVLGLFVVQPDFSMSVILSCIWVSQLFIYGIPYFILILLFILFVLGAVLCFYCFPYIRKRIFMFFDPGHHDNFQIGNSIKSFRAGKLIGTGPGEGSVKLMLPDCHTDFIFSVAAEEFGMILCVIILLIFGYISARMWIFAYRENTLFKLIVMSGLSVQFSAQFLINIGVVLNLLPTTGVALPFLSYGGSSLISISMAFGIFLAFSRERVLVRRIFL